MKQEIWAPLPSDKHYQISSHGGVKRLAGKTVWGGKAWYSLPELVMSPTVMGSGYLVVRISGKNKYIHRLVAEAFLKGRTDIRCEVNHKDGNKANNAPENLEWCSRKENIQHAWEMKFVQPGEAHHASKLSEDMVRSILVVQKVTGAKHFRLHKKYFPNICKATIQKIIDGKSWAHIDRNDLFNTKKVKAICN